MKKKYFSGFAGKDYKKYDPTLPILTGCYKPDERRRLNDLAASMSRNELSTLAYDRLVKGAKALRSSAPVILDLTVKHGDIIVMHGDRVQKYFEVFSPCSLILLGLLAKSRISTRQIRLGNYVLLSPAGTSNRK